VHAGRPGWQDEGDNYPTEDFPGGNYVKTMAEIAKRKETRAARLQDNSMA